MAQAKDARRQARCLNPKTKAGAKKVARAGCARNLQRILIGLNVRFLIGAAKASDMPIILSTVGVKMGVNRPMKKSIRSAIPEVQEIDRSSMDAWEDEAFRSYQQGGNG